MSVAVSAGNEQTGPAGEVLPAPIAAKVTDASGRGVPNVPLDFAVIEGGGSIPGTATRTNGAGIATASWRVGTLAGRPQRIVARLLDTLTGALLDTAVFSASVSAGAPASVVAIFGNQLVGAVGQSVPLPLRVVVRDAYGNLASGATVSWIVVSGAGTLSAATTTSNAQGIATNLLTPGNVESDVEVRASLVGRPPAILTVLLRRVTARAAFLSGSGFGIARAPNGRLIVSLIYNGQVERVSPGGAEPSTIGAVGGTPVVTAVDAAGQFAYAANMGTGVLSVIDVASMAKVIDIEIPGEAHSLAMSPRGDRVYVTNTANSVFAVDVATRSVVRTTTVGPGPWGIAFWTTATDSLMYVTARDGASISEVDMRTGTLLRTLSVTGRPHGIAISPDGATLYVADDSGGEILFVNRAAGGVTRRVTASGAFGLAIAPDGNTLYVTTNQGSILVVDVASATITKQEPTMGQARQIVVTPDGNTAFAANLSGWVDMITR